MLSPKQKKKLNILKKTNGYDISLNKSAVQLLDETELFEALMIMDMSQKMAGDMNEFLAEMESDITDDRCSLLLLSVLSDLTNEILTNHKSIKSADEFIKFFNKYTKLCKI